MTTPTPRASKTCTHGEVELRSGRGGGARCRLCGTWARFDPDSGLDVERLARAMARFESQAPDDASDSERAEWQERATDIAAEYARLTATDPEP